MSDVPPAALPQLVATLGGSAIALAFVGGLVICVVGRLLHRPFWKVGARLSVGAVASVVIYGGVELVALATTFSLTGSDRLEALLFVALGVLGVGAGVGTVRWVVRYDIADALSLPGGSRDR